MVETRDVIVVGGGPAGAVIATLLARAGRDVLLVERRVAHEGKACGHCLSAVGLAHLDRLGLAGCVRAASVQRVGALIVHVERLPPLRLTMEKPSAVVRREVLDQALRTAAREAGTEVRVECSARVLALDEDAAIIEMRDARGVQHVRTPLLIGADGLGSRIARAADIQVKRSRSRGFGFATDAIIDPSHTNPFRESLHMFLAPHGYLGAVVHDASTLHLGGLVRRRSAVDSSPSAFVRSMGDRFPMLDSIEAKGARVTACGPMPFEPFAAARGCAALIGDAAGYIEPFTGEGMTWAIETAELLHASLRDERFRWTPRTRHHYCAAIMQWRTSRQRWCRRIRSVLEHEALLRVAHGAARRQPRIATRLLQEITSA